MPRKGENIRKRKDGRWEARYIKERKADGSIRYGYLYAQRYADVKEKREAMLRTLANRETVLQESFQANCLDPFLDEWKREIRPYVKDSSFFFYETLLEHHLRPYFGRMPVRQLNSRCIQSFINLKVQEHLSPAYIRSILLVLQNVFKVMQRKYDQFPVFPACQLPRQSKKQLEIFTVQEWKILDKYLKQQQDTFSFGILLCMYTGLRIGELSGLKWGDYDGVNVQFKIRRTVYRIKNEACMQDPSLPKTILCIDSPKTQSSVRDIPLPYSLLPEIRRFQKRDDCYILTGSARCMEPRNIQKRFRTLLKHAGLRYLNFHSLRHSFATLSIQNGSDYKTVAELLGHSSVNTTLNIYVHSSLEHKRQCLNLLIQ